MAPNPIPTGSAPQTTVTVFPDGITYTPETLPYATPTNFLDGLPTAVTTFPSAAPTTFFDGLPAAVTTFLSASPTTFRNGLPTAVTTVPYSGPNPTLVPGPSQPTPSGYKFNDFAQARYSKGEIAGIVITSAAIVVMIPMMGYICYRKYKNAQRHDDRQTEGPITVAPFSSKPRIFGKLFGKRATTHDEEKAAEAGISTNANRTSASRASSNASGGHRRSDTYLPLYTTHPGPSRT